MRAAHGAVPTAFLTVRLLNLPLRQSVAASFALAIAGGAFAPNTSNAADSVAPAEVVLPLASQPAIGYTMAQVGPGSGVLTTGLSIPDGPFERTMLVRAAGPSLSGFGVVTPLSRPVITIFNANGERVARNDDWAHEADKITEASLAAGTFPFPASSKDAALVTSLAPGNYTVQVSSGESDTGVVLLEVYDVSASSRRVAGEGAASSPSGAAPRLTDARQALASPQLLAHLPLNADLKDALGQPIRAKAVHLRDGAAWFDGKDSEILLPNVALSRRAFAVAMWIKLEDDFPGIGFAHQRAGARRNEHLHLMLRDAAPRLGFYINDLQASRRVTPRDGWAHLVFQYNGREQEIWVNGQRVAARAARPYVGKAGDLVIGKAPRWTNVPAHDFKGGMRDLRVYSRALAPIEIRALAKF